MTAIPTRVTRIWSYDQIAIADGASLDLGTDLTNLQVTLQYAPSYGDISRILLTVFPAIAEAGISAERNRMMLAALAQVSILSLIMFMKIRFTQNPTVRRTCLGAIVIILAASRGTALAQEKSGPVSPERARAEFGKPVVLAADDVRAFPEAPAGFNKPPAGGMSGRTEVFEYDSTVTGTRRKAVVYLPPHYSAERKYPVLFLLHGIGGNEWEWNGYVHADAIIDNLIVAGKATPMIVVMPNCRALADDRAPAPDKTFSPQNAEGFAKFERDLLDCLIPALQAKYSASTNREQRALAGLSMGGGQSLNFGLKHLDTFAWVAGFSSAPNTKPPAELVPDPTAARERLKLLYLSCGNKDGLISISQGVHTYLKQRSIPHTWNVDDHGHDGQTWSSNLYHFAQRLFVANKQ